MRVLHVVYTPRYSGAEMLVASLTEVHAKMGHVSQVVAMNPPEDDFKLVMNRQQLEGTDWLAPPTPMSRAARLRFLRATATLFQPDVTFAHSVIPAAYARMAGCKNVISVLHSASNYAAGYLRFFENFLQHRLAGVISVSEPARLDYSSNFSAPKTKFIPNGIELGCFTGRTKNRKLVRQNLGINSTDLLVVQVGRLDPVKQQHLSLEAMLPIIKDDPSVHLIIAGLIENERYFAALKSTCQRAGVECNVHFLGPRNDVPDLLGAADLFLMPSLREAQGIAMVEALASGLPVIGSRISGFKFAEGFEGVTLLAAENAGRFTSAIRAALAPPRRYERDLCGFDIRDTAKAYIEFASECTY